MCDVVNHCERSGLSAQPPRGLPLTTLHTPLRLCLSPLVCSRRRVMSAIRSRLYAWGWNRYGQAPSSSSSHASASASASAPASASLALAPFGEFNSPVVSLSCGPTLTAAITADGAAHVYGQLF